MVRLAFFVELPDGGAGGAAGAARAGRAALAQARNALIRAEGAAAVKLPISR